MNQAASSVRLAALCAAVWAAASSAAAAQTQPAAVPQCETTRCVAQEDDSASAALLWVPRGVLRVPRLAVDASLRLVVLAARVEEKYDVIESIDDVLFNDARTFGIVPSAFYETGFKPSIGARVLHRDLFGRREALKLRALYADVGQQLYTFDLQSGVRFDDLSVHAGAAYERNDALRFHGLGTAELVASVRGHGAISAFERGIATPAYYESEEGRGAIGLSARLSPRLQLGATAQLRRRDLSTGDPSPEDRSFGSTPWVDEVFTATSLTGLGRARTDGYGELVVSWDGRKPTRSHLPLDLAATGPRLATWLGYQSALAGDSGNFVRAGADARHYIDLARGDRILMLRVRTSWAIGRLRSIPFPDLPSLGGSKLLRGYTAGRFHDRGSLLATVEYRYPVQDNISSYLFVDAGRVLDDWRDISTTGMRELRVSWGAGLYLFSGSGLLLRGQLASSIDGGLFIQFLLDADDAYARTT
jgi:outer membrane protein assembly factor BamA